MHNVLCDLSANRLLIHSERPLFHNRSYIFHHYVDSSLLLPLLSLSLAMMSNVTFVFMDCTV